ncbi:hypothetical protein PFLCHA0_c35010 [Pseudomonas protegens CHA0]|uniref:Uncharacterized protein n=1 Tax=Pseudomonas protegens (strain DSM 19095 / LMG 27888 / CFBP 6595 / CHA0) TaxID=1124983 RepID=A0A2C9ENU1_PSEPH|nr:hypothetical protein PFLCHA0_c35010 [Pseudomonas protegens CHA0]
MAVHRLLPVVFVGRTNRSAVHRRSARGSRAGGCRGSLFP